MAVVIESGGVGLAKVASVEEEYDGAVRDVPEEEIYSFLGYFSGHPSGNRHESREIHIICILGSGFYKVQMFTSRVMQ